MQEDDDYLKGLRSFDVVLMTTLVHFIQFIMFIKGFLNGFNINSTACHGVVVDPLSGTATVQFHDGNAYHYTNVSRRAIIKFLMDDARSLGKFVNNVCQASRTKCTSIVF